MSIERHNLYGGIHKGIRAALGELMVRAGRTDYTDGAERAALARAVDETFALLRSHAEHEDRIVEPLVRAAAPGVASALDAAHADQEGRLDALGAQLAAVSGDRAAALGHAFTVALSRLCGDLLVHMADEEELAMPALQAALDDAALLQVHETIVANLSAEEKARAMAVVLPAASRTERAEMLAGMRSQAPAPAFAAVLELARGVLSPADMGDLSRRLGLAEAA